MVSILVLQVRRHFKAAAIQAILCALRYQSPWRQLRRGRRREVRERREAMVVKAITINRAPVLTLWATVVAERLGCDSDEALTLGKAVAGLGAQSKGRRLGIFHPSKEKAERARERKAGEVFFIQIVGRPVPAVTTDGGIRAAIKGKPIDPDSVTRYLDKKFGEQLAAVRDAMEVLAEAFDPGELAGKAYYLYERFRPEIPAGKRGWGAKGELNLDYIRSLAVSKE
jgi:hypothetical protein